MHRHPYWKHSGIPRVYPNSILDNESSKYKLMQNTVDKFGSHHNKVF